MEMAGGKGDGDGNGWRQHNKDGGSNGLFSLLNNPLFAPHIIQALKNPVSPLMLYLLHSYFIILQR
jgi:hypothetical protein